MTNFCKAFSAFYELNLPIFTSLSCMQIGTTVVALIGEVIGFSYTRGSFRTAHSITALCVVFVTFPQVSLGAAAMRKSSNPNYNKLHRGTGYFLVGLALWQVRKGCMLSGGAHITALSSISMCSQWVLVVFHQLVLHITVQQSETDVTPWSHSLYE